MDFFWRIECVVQTKEKEKNEEKKDCLRVQNDDSTKKSWKDQIQPSVSICEMNEMVFATLNGCVYAGECVEIGLMASLIQVVIPQKNHKPVHRDQMEGKTKLIHPSTVTCYPILQFNGN